MSGQGVTLWTGGEGPRQELRLVCVSVSFDERRCRSAGSAPAKQRCALAACQRQKGRLLFGRQLAELQQQVCRVGAA